MVVEEENRKKRCREFDVVSMWWRETCMPLKKLMKSKKRDSFITPILLPPKKKEKNRLFRSVICTPLLKVIKHQQVHTREIM